MKTATSLQTPPGSLEALPSSCWKAGPSCGSTSRSPTTTRCRRLRVKATFTRCASDENAPGRSTVVDRTITSFSMPCCQQESLRVAAAESQLSPEYGRAFFADQYGHGSRQEDNTIETNCGQ